ncbi:SurA N-terminal domain-containing protein [Breoghania sp.]|uniref:SurA N-terminal domain-containing protein n=1 Tax=Breoghania sp. TaxID=2065378 RepID=UPI002AA7DE13|nr:SurA N-terminal domain-containing protein [Breoghania sp.]
MMPTTAIPAGRPAREATARRWIAVARTIAAAVAVACSLGLLSLSPALAATTIKVIVNDQPITSYDIDQRARLIQLTARKPASVARRMAKEELIDERLKAQEAKRRGISVSDARVNEAFANIARRTKMSASQLGKALRQSGVNPDTLKKRIRMEMIWLNVVRSRFSAQINISEQDVLAEMLKQDKAKDDNKTLEYTLTQIIFVVPKNGSAGLKARRKREATQLRNRFTTCEDGVKLAEGLKEVVVKPVGVRMAPELPEQMNKLLADVKVGHLSRPVETGNGIETYAVCKKREISSNLELRSEIKDELRNKEGQMLSRRYIRDLRRDAVIEYR